MAKNRRPSGTGPRRKHQQKPQLKRQQQLIVVTVVLAVILVIGIFAFAIKQPVDASYYKHVTPAQLERVVKGNEPVLVYFHSPT